MNIRQHLWSNTFHLNIRAITHVLQSMLLVLNVLPYKLRWMFHQNGYYSRKIQAFRRVKTFRYTVRRMDGPSRPSLGVSIEELLLFSFSSIGYLLCVHICCLPNNNRKSNRSDTRWIQGIFIRAKCDALRQRVITLQKNHKGCTRALSMWSKKHYRRWRQQGYLPQSEWWDRIIYFCLVLAFHSFFCLFVLIFFCRSISYLFNGSLSCWKKSLRSFYLIACND